MTEKEDEPGVPRGAERVATRRRPAEYSWQPEPPPTEPAARSHRPDSPSRNPRFPETTQPGALPQFAGVHEED